MKSKNLVICFLVAFCFMLTAQYAYDKYFSGDPKVPASSKPRFSLPPVALPNKVTKVFGQTKPNPWGGKLLSAYETTHSSKAVIGFYRTTLPEDGWLRRTEYSKVKLEAKSHTDTYVKGNFLLTIIVYAPKSRTTGCDFMINLMGRPHDYFDKTPKNIVSGAGKD